MDNTVAIKTLQDGLRKANMEQAAQAGRGDERLGTLAGHTERLQQLVDNVHGLLNLTAEQVGLSVKHRTQMELLKTVPFFKDIMNMINTLEGKQRHEEARGDGILVDMETANRNIWNRLDSHDTVLTSISEAQTQSELKVGAFTKSISSNVQHIKDTCAMKTDLEYLTTQIEFQDSLARVDHLDKRLQDQFDAAAQEREALAKELQKKSDWEALVGKADKEEVGGKLQKLTLNLKTLNDVVDDLQRELAKVREEAGNLGSFAHASPASAAQRSPAFASQEAPGAGGGAQHRASTGWVNIPQAGGASGPSGGAPPAVRSPSAPPGDQPGGHARAARQADVPRGGDGAQHVQHEDLAALSTALDTRLEAAETAIGILDGVKVNRDDVWGIAKELVDAAAADGSFARGGAQQQPPPPASQAPPVPPQYVLENQQWPADPNATALRFRCLSCNQPAGNLVDETQEGKQAVRFPPGSTINAPDGAARRAPSPTAATPSGANTTTRKKLLNYYEWLRTKSASAQSGRAASPARGDDRDVPERPQTAQSQRRASSPEGSPRPRCPSPHVWDGSQAGGGETATRQGGDHGSNAPHAIGRDGRFYSGVKRPPPPQHREVLEAAEDLAAAEAPPAGDPVVPSQQRKASRRRPTINT
eukprot:TRINITY_DN2075_c0_g2_i9.p2 TRINITY_DN2075_c0_g2~~TRINITY_DN2075_c0_g2_i9.p2  ORF type:complete len:646 (+),score=261.92 TRINITY_DN2075_c0_g2_i9:472-2409(+)